MKFLSIGCNNLCSAANDSFKTANNSSSVTVVKCGKKFDQLGGGGWGRAGQRGTGREVQSFFRAQAIYWWLDSWIKRHTATNDHMDFAASMTASNSTWFPPSQCGLQWLVCSQVGKGSSLISRLIHIPSELGRIEVWMWRIIINTRAVSPLHRSSRTLHNYTADRSSNQTRPGRPWPKH